jgi:hypothetical protein
MTIEMVNPLVFGECVGVPFPWFGFQWKEGKVAEDFVKSVEAEAREVVGEMSDKEYLACRAISGMMPHLNRVFEGHGNHHEEHEVRAKVHKTLEDKAKKATAKNTTTVAEARKRKGTGRSKVVSKKRKTGAASVAASAALKKRWLRMLVESLFRAR